MTGSRKIRLGGMDRTHFLLLPYNGLPPRGEIKMKTVFCAVLSLASALWLGETAVGEDRPGNVDGPIDFKVKWCSYEQDEKGADKSPDSKWTVKARGDELEIDDADSGRPVFPKLKQPVERDRLRKMKVTTWAFSSGGKMLAIGIGDANSANDKKEAVGGVSVWDLQTGKLVASRYSDNKRGGYVGWVYRLVWEDDKKLRVECEEPSSR